MSYQPNIISKGDIVIIGGCKFLAKNDFNKQVRHHHNRVVLEYIEEVREPVVYNANVMNSDGITRKPDPRNPPKPTRRLSNGVRRYEA